MCPRSTGARTRANKNPEPSPYLFAHIRAAHALHYGQPMADLLRSVQSLAAFVLCGGCYMSSGLSDAPDIGPDGGRQDIVSWDASVSPDATIPPRVDAGPPPNLDAGPALDTGLIHTCLLGPRPDASDEAALFVWIRSALIGDWTGSRLTDWDGRHDITMQINADGSWGADCPGGCGTLGGALYWGTDGYGEGRTWEVNDVRADGRGVGIIWLQHFGGTTSSRDFTDIDVSENARELRFNVVSPGASGPVEVELRRVTPGCE